MTKEFIPYEQALALKELGFDEPCIAIHSINLMTENEDWELRIGGVWTNQELVDSIKAPTFSQAFRWFREKYNLFHNIWNYTHGEPTDLIPNGFTFSIDEDWITIIGKNELGYFEKYYKTYEEAELACLKKLIEIVKTK